MATPGRPHTSVILPVYNGQKFLRESIDSVASQSMGDYELIIWDDRSTDSSGEIISAFKDRRIRTFSNPINKGLFPTLNLAIAKSRGEWIRLWSQDDVMKETCLEKELDFVARHPNIGMAYCGWDTIDEEGRVTAPMHEDATPDLISTELSAQIMLYHGSITGNIANVRIRRSAFDRVGQFREDMRISGDFEMWVRLSSLYAIGFLREPLIKLRRHKEQFSRQPGSHLTSLVEDQEIYKALLARMPLQLKQYAWQYHRYARQSLYVQCLVRCIFSRNWKGFNDLYRATNRLDNMAFAVASYWLVTANQHLYKMKPKYSSS